MSLKTQFRQYSVALISLVLALSGLAYNKWHSGRIDVRYVLATLD